MHHKCFIEAITVQLASAAVLHMDHRRLTKGGQQLVGRVSAKHQRAVGTACRPHGVAPGKERMERRVGVPGLIKMQHVDTTGQHLLDQFSVVAQPVIGGVGDNGHFYLRCPPLGQGVGLDLGADRFRAEFTQRNRPDDAQLVALRAQVQGDCAGHDDRVYHRLVAVAIHQHQVIATDHRVPDDLVGCGRTVDDEEGVIGTKILCRAGFGRRQGPGVIQQRTQLRHRNREVRTQGVFTKELMKRQPHRALAICHTAAMPRGVPGIVGLGGVLHQRFEKWWQQAIEVIVCRPRHLPGQKRHGVFEQVENSA
ncbi:hypothetical protein D3C79_624930 [compost metagenome]